MDTKSLKEIQNNDVVRKRLAKFMARECFRNTKLEGLHAGTFPFGGSTPVATQSAH